MTTATANFAPRTLENAPEGSVETLTNVNKKYGFIPNLIGGLANSPVAVKAYTQLAGIMDEGTFSPCERQLINLAASVENECGYCTAAHSTILKGQLNTDADTVSAIRNGNELADPKLNALVHTVREIVRERGHLSDVTKESFLAAGYEPEQLLELLVGVSMKTLSNYFDHISPVEIDAVFATEV